MVSAARKLRIVREGGVEDTRPASFSLHQDRRPRSAEQLAAMRKFRATNFRGGTLVEYEDEFRFTIELRRWKIKEVSIIGTQLLVQSVGKAKLECNDVSQLIIEERNRVFLITGAHCPCAMAPAGVKIEKKPEMEEVLEKARAALAEKKK